MNNITTTIEQSKKLIELGLDEDTADMYYRKGHPSVNEYPYVLPKDMMIDSVSVLCPAWSLSALLDLMPEAIDNMDNKYSLKIDKELDYLCICYEETTFIHAEESKDFVKAAYNMVCWLIENGYIKTKKK